MCQQSTRTVQQLSAWWTKEEELQEPNISGQESTWLGRRSNREKSEISWNIHSAYLIGEHQAEQMFDDQWAQHVLLHNSAKVCWWQYYQWWTSNLLADSHTLPSEHNHITREKNHSIRTCSIVSDHKDDVESFLIWLCHHICQSPDEVYITLMDPCFALLLTTKIACLQWIVEDWPLESHSEEGSFMLTSFTWHHGARGNHPKPAWREQYSRCWPIAKAHLKGLQHLQTHNTGCREASLRNRSQHGMTSHQPTLTKLTNSITGFGIGAINVVHKANG
jgi:hypothetical protein